MRLEPADHTTWSHRLRYMLPPHPRKVQQATTAIERFLDQGDATVSVSWGKDSVAVAHLATLIKPDIAMQWVAVDGLEPPDSYRVRDDFLRTHPHVQYQETTVELPIMRGEPRFPGPDVDILGAHNPGRTITGVRAAESKQRALSAAVHGISTARTCRPILNWSTIEVFGYLRDNSLPIHVSYQASMGGTLTLDDIRVHTLATATLHSSSYWERITRWEDHYYGDIISQELTRRARH